MQLLSLQGLTGTHTSNREKERQQCHPVQNNQITKSHTHTHTKPHLSNKGRHKPKLQRMLTSSKMIKQLCQIWLYSQLDFTSRSFACFSSFNVKAQKDHYLAPNERLCRLRQSTPPHAWMLKIINHVVSLGG